MIKVIHIFFFQEKNIHMRKGGGRERQVLLDVGQLTSPRHASVSQDRGRSPRTSVPVATLR